jgi:Uma2 family endonuclease
MLYVEMSAATHPRYTIEEYVKLEQRSNVKHEYLDGVVWAMGGGTPEHAAIASAIIAALGAQLRDRPCRVYTSDARVRVEATGLDTYPDVTVVCGREERDSGDKLALTNPIVLVEITSESSEAYDRGEKLKHYKRITTVREIVIVSHRERRVDLHHRESEGGVWTTVTARDRVELGSVRCTLDVAEIYRDPFAS